MHIAICDDSAHDRKSLCQALQAFSVENGLGAEIDLIEDGELLLAMEPELLSEVELFFLDIYMERSNGFDVARVLRARRVAAPIVFLTSSPDFAVQSYEVEAFSYLLKPVPQGKLKALMQRFLQGYQPRSIFLAGRLFVQEDIVFAESDLKNVTLHLRDGTSARVREKLDTVEQRLKGSSFLRCHQSYLVNLRYVCRLENETFITSLDRPVLIRKRDFPELRKRYYDYLKSVAGVGGSL
ncbi:LytR/AlgR family response regulator transcription factor [Oscillibacter sp. GMB15532]|uniref:LytR/AlgR family response regulator transcription factor n=1 Tax=Oscillibacter sp. GMB15532 TaxID=3230022 RepID=UPI0034DE24E1